ncbi:30235_t:CDS:2, partial [Racocetra persica]
SGRYPDDYKQVIDKYGDKIHLLHINNVMKKRKIKQKDRSVKKIKATIFGFEQDVHALLLQGQLSQEIFKMLATHPKYVKPDDTLQTDDLLFKTEFQKIEELEKEKASQTQSKYEAPEI